MLQTITRPFTDAERERIEAELIKAVADPKPKYEEAFGSGALYAFFGLIFAVPLTGAAVVLGLTGYWLFAIPALCATVGFVLGFRDGFVESAWQVQARKEHTATLATRLGRGEIMETTVTASAVAVATEPDEGDFTGYFFDIGNNRVLFVWDYDTSGNFVYNELSPSSFAFTQFPGGTEDVADFVATEKSLKPSRHLFFEQTDEDWSDTFYTGAVFENVSLATLETDLPYLMATPDEPEP